MSCRVENFEYPSNAGPSPVLWKVMTEIGAEPDCIGVDDCGEQVAETHRDDRERFNTTSVEETKRIFEAGRDQGMREAQVAAADAHRELSRQEESNRAERTVHLAAQFAAERDRFLQTVEHDVVKLALAIAARVLRREAQVDPLFLLGAVRVVLGQLAETMQVKLRIPADETQLWTDTIAHLPNLKTVPSVISDDRMQLGECVIETEMGSVDLAITSQLRETERSLFHRSHAKARESKTACVRNDCEDQV
jgi:flagellar biosynthesis/type III secretory pathway protein FliH